VAIADDVSSVKQIRAKDIQNLARSLDSPSQSTNFSDNSINTENQATGDRDDHHQTTSAQSEIAPETEEVETIPPEPEYNAWEVWTYLERQRLKTLKLISTFQAEWEANRFVREAERSAPPTLRVHYEIRPVWLDEAEINASHQREQNPHKSQDSQAERESEEYRKEYVDAIDVEVLT